MGGPPGEGLSGSDANRSGPAPEGAKPNGPPAAAAAAAAAVVAVVAAAGTTWGGSNEGQEWASIKLLHLLLHHWS